MNIEYRKIPQTFSKHGWDYTLLKREEDVAMYDQGGYAREVVVVRRHDGRKIADSVIPPAEYLPSDNEWGRLGWTFSPQTHNDFIADSETRFNALVAKQRLPKTK